jgi:hypothetical protein
VTIVFLLNRRESSICIIANRPFNCGGGSSSLSYIIASKARRSIRARGSARRRNWRVCVARASEAEWCGLQNLSIAIRRIVLTRFRSRVSLCRSSRNARGSANTCFQPDGGAGEDRRHPRGASNKRLTNETTGAVTVTQFRRLTLVGALRQCLSATVVAAMRTEGGIFSRRHRTPPRETLAPDHCHRRVALQRPGVGVDHL